MRVQCTRSARIPPQSVVLEVAGFQGSQESSHLTGVVRKYTHNIYEGSKEAHPLNPQKEGINKGAGWTGVAPPAEHRHSIHHHMPATRDALVGGEAPPLSLQPPQPMVEPLSSSVQVPASMAFATDRNRPRLLSQPPPNTRLTASQAPVRGPLPSNASLQRLPYTTCCTPSI